MRDMDPTGFDAQKMLDLYILDYMKKKNMHEAAATFADEASVSSNVEAIESDEGLLHEWWSVFWEAYNSDQQEKPDAQAESSAQDEPRNVGNQQPQFPVGVSSGSMMGQPSISFPAAAMYKERSILPPGDYLENTQISDLLACAQASSSNASWYLPRAFGLTQAAWQHANMALARNLETQQICPTVPETSMHHAVPQFPLGANYGNNMLGLPPLPLPASFMYEEHSLLTPGDLLSNTHVSDQLLLEQASSSNTSQNLRQAFNTNQAAQERANTANLSASSMETFAGPDPTPYAAEYCRGMELHHNAGKNKGVDPSA